MVRTRCHVFLIDQIHIVLQSVPFVFLLMLLINFILHVHHIHGCVDAYVLTTTQLCILVFDLSDDFQLILFCLSSICYKIYTKKLSCSEEYKTYMSRILHHNVCIIWNIATNGKILNCANKTTTVISYVSYLLCCVHGLSYITFTIILKLCYCT